MDFKNFVVTFSIDNDNINTIMESTYKKDIMDIMIAINKCSSYEEAKNRKIFIIQDYINNNMKYVDYLNYLYGYINVIEEYINRFGPISYSPILNLDFATIILDNIIKIHEIIDTEPDVFVKEEFDNDTHNENFQSNSVVSTPYSYSSSSLLNNECD